MKKIAFCTDNINVRGTCVALYDYAIGNEEILNNESIIVMPKNGVVKSDPAAFTKFISRFNIYTYNDVPELKKILHEEKCTHFYRITYGKKEPYEFDEVKTLIHCVFDMSEPYGHVYAGVSKSIADKFNQKLYVPHMISLTPCEKHNYKKELGIPENAIVFGRYGGMDTFNLPFCWKVIDEISRENNNVYFLFMNTPKVVQNKNIIYMDSKVKEHEKNKFINTCDAYLECSNMGHSFGLAIGEFSVNNKPSICYNNRLWNTEHIRILGDKGIYFKDEQEFKKILTEWKKSDHIDRDYNCYREYNQKNVMKIFDEVFLQD